MGMGASTSTRRRSAPSRVSLGGANVSAAVFFDQRRLIEELHGKELVDAAIATMTRESQAELATLLPMSWASIATTTEFYLAVAHATAQDPVVFHRKMVRAGLERTFTTFWRFMMRLTSVEALLKRVALVYAKSYDRGVMMAKLIEPGVAEVTLSGWNDVPDLEIDAIVCGAEVMLQVSGRPSATVEASRMPGGARFLVRFTP